MRSTRHFTRAHQAPALPATPFAFICCFIARYRTWYIAMVVLEAAHAGCNISLPYAVSRIIKSVTEADRPARELPPTLAASLGLFVLLSIGEVLFARAAGTCQITIGPRQRQNVTRNLYAYLQQHSHRYLTNNFAGAIAHRISETSQGVTQTLWALIFDFWPIAIVLGTAVCLLSQAHAELALFVGGWAVLFVAVSYYLATRCQPFAHRASAARSEATGKMVDSVTNLTSAKLFARLDYERRYLDRYLVKEMHAFRRASWYSGRVRWFQFTAAAVLKVGVLYHGLSLWGEGKIDVAEFVMAVSLALMIINEARNLSRRFLEFFESIGNVANGVESIVRPHELVDAPTAEARELPFGRIELRDVEFGYSPERKVFEKLSLTIAAGQRVGLVGSSGSGKSTLVSLALRLYDPQAGAILIDGIDVRRLTQDSLHAQLSLIPQDPALFHRTLMENIRYGKLEATDHEVVEAAKKAHAHDFISHMPEGYDSMVGERGVKLSGGQRQRIAIARVILKDAPILILDEATSSLDSITERAIDDALRTVMRGKTVLVVAHRLSTVAHLDRILVFEHGRVVEDGSHAELFARRGAYHALWTRQSDGFSIHDGESELAGDEALVALPMTTGEPEPHLPSCRARAVERQSAPPAPELVEI